MVFVHHKESRSLFWPLRFRLIFVLIRILVEQEWLYQSEYRSTQGIKPDQLAYGAHEVSHFGVETVTFRVREFSACLTLYHTIGRIQLMGA